MLWNRKKMAKYFKVMYASYLLGFLKGLAARCYSLPSEARDTRPAATTTYLIQKSFFLPLADLLRKSKRLGLRGNYTRNFLLQL